MIGDEVGKLSKQKARLTILGNAEADLEKARAKAYTARQAVVALQRELKFGPPRKDWARDFEAAKIASERAAKGVEKARDAVARADAAFRQAGGAAGGYVANMQRVGAELDRVQARQAKLNQYLQAKSALGESSPRPWGLFPIRFRRCAMPTCFSTSIPVCIQVLYQPSSTESKN